MSEIVANLSSTKEADVEDELFIMEERMYL